MFIIGLGAAAIGMIIGTRNLVVPGMQGIWQDSKQAMINLYTSPVSEDELLVLKRVEGVQQIEGLSNTTIEWRLNPQDEWQQGSLTARVDYENQSLSTLELTSGKWPEEKVVLVEDGTDSFFGIPIGGVVTLRANDREEKVQVGGTLYNAFSLPAYFGGSAQFYSTQDLYERLIGNRDFTQIKVNAPAWDEDAVTELANRLQDKLEKQGKQSGRFITDPNKHFFQDQIDGLFFILGALGALALVLGLLLIYNTINALIARQVDQIGVLKAVGARTWQILLLFTVTVLIYGLLATLLALPLGIYGAWGITSWLVGSFGAEMDQLQISQPAVISMVIITMLAPVLASLFPILGVARITVREAISSYGLAKKPGLIGRLLGRLRFISRMFLLTITNTFRNKWRVVLLEIVLVISGLITMMVVSMRDSAIYTVNDVIFSILGADMNFIFEDPQRIDHIEELTLQHPAVRAVETWAVTGGTVRPAGQPESDDDETIALYGVPLPTEMYGYQLRQGRWLLPEDTYAIVLNRNLVDEINSNLAPEDKIGVGDWITIKYAEKRERDWQIVGLVFDPIQLNSSSVRRDVLLHDLNQPGRVGSIWIDTISQEPTVQIAVAKALREYFEQNHVDISPQRGAFGMGDTTAETAEVVVSQFNFIIILLGLMAVVIGTVGAIALSGTISLNVMERVREIGVMRAVGASSWDIGRLFIGEGLILGWLSWLIALPLSMPAGRLMVASMSQAFQTEYIYHYTPTGAILWLGIITIVSILASWFPARAATRISVRESLVYQ